MTAGPKINISAMIKNKAWNDETPEKISNESEKIKVVSKESETISFLGDSKLLNAFEWQNWIFAFWTEEGLFFF